MLALVVAFVLGGMIGGFVMALITTAVLGDLRAEIARLRGNLEGDDASLD